MYSGVGWTGTELSLSKKQKIRQASEIWSMLDSLSNSDPVAYRKFIKDQLEAGKAITAPPEPRLLIRASTFNIKNPFVYLLLCSWSRIPENKNENEPINLIGGEPYEVIDNFRKNLTTKLYPLAFSEKFANEILSNENNNKSQLEVIDMSLDFIKNQQKISINTENMYEICQDKLIGSLDKLYESFKYKSFDPESEFKECFGDITQKPDLIQEISKLKENDDSEEELNELKLKPTAATETNNNKSLLIEELNEPIINVNHSNRLLTIEIPLSNVKSIKEIELDISENCLHLEIPSLKSFPPIRIDFPTQILIESCEAKYRRKLDKLFINASIK